MEKEIGLVLSGGGTKGIAEAGVIKFLETPGELSKSFLKKLDLKSCKIHQDPSVDGVWAVDNLATKTRVIVYLEDKDWEVGTLK